MPTGQAHGQAPLHVPEWQYYADRPTHLRLRDHKRPQAVIANGARYCEHSHHANAIPKQNLSASSLHTCLEADRKQ